MVQTKFPMYQFFYNRNFDLTTFFTSLTVVYRYSTQPFFRNTSALPSSLSRSLYSHPQSVTLSSTLFNVTIYYSLLSLSLSFSLYYLVVILLIVKGRLDEVGGERALALDVGRPATGELVARVLEHLRRVLRHLDLAHLAAAVHARGYVHRVAPNVVLGLLRAHDSRDHRAVV